MSATTKTVKKSEGFCRDNVAAPTKDAVRRVTFFCRDQHVCVCQQTFSKSCKWILWNNSDIQHENYDEPYMVLEKTSQKLLLKFCCVLVAVCQQW